MTGLVGVYLREFRRLKARPDVLMIFFGAIVVYSFYYPQPFIANVLREAPIAIVDKDHTLTSIELSRLIDATGEVDVVMRVSDVAEAKNAVLAREIYGYVYIPQYFERDLLSGRQSPLALYAGANIFLIYKKVSSAIRNVAATVGAGTVVNRLVAQGIDTEVAELAAQPFGFTAIPLFNPEGGYATYVIPAVFLLIMQQVLLMGTGMMNTLEFNDGPAIIASPLQTVAGKVLAYSTLQLFTFPFVTIIVPWLYDVPRIGDFWQSVLIGIPFILSAATLGLILARVFREPLAVQISCACLGMPFFYLTDIVWPREQFADWFLALSKFVPSSTANEAIVRINQMAADVHLFSDHVILLVGLMLMYGLIAVLLEKRHQSALGRGSS